MSNHYFVVQVQTREQAEEIGKLLADALPAAIAEGRACFDKKMHIISSDAVLQSTHEKLEALIREQPGE